MRNIKMLGLLAIAALALVAFVGTSVASASQVFTADQAGEQIIETTTADNELIITGSDVECDDVGFTGETEGTATTTLTLTPTYSSPCDAFGLDDAGQIDTNNCDFTFSSTTSGEPGHANISLTGCDDETEGINITANLTPFVHCIVDVPEQTIGTAVGYANTGSESISLDFTADEIMVDVTVSQGFCPLTTGTHSGANGATYKGLSDLTTANGLQYSS